MDETPREPRPPADEVVEHREVTERRAAPDRIEVRDSRPAAAWLWVVPLLLVVVVLVWFALTRGEPRAPTLPEVEVPAAESPQPDQRIEIELPAPQQPAAPPADQPPAQPPANQAPPDG